MALAKGVSLSFELITASVAVHSALEDKPKNKSVCVGTNGAAHAPIKINQVRHCADCGEVPYAEVKKAREVAGGFVLLEAEEIKEAKADAEKYKKLASLTKHDANEVESGTVPGEKLYYLTPEPGAEQTYAVLRHVVDSNPHLAFLTRWTPRSAAATFALRVRGDVLVLQERVPAAATRPSPGVTADAPEALLAVADQFVGLTEPVPFDPALYADSFEENIQRVIATKTAIALGEAPAPTPTKVETPSNDLMANLAAFVAASVNDKPKKAAAKKAAPKKKVSA